MLRSLLISTCLVLATIGAYWPVHNAEFVNFDDNQYITHNPHVFHGLTKASVKWAFTSFHSSNWHPLTWLSHMQDCQIFSDNAGSHHLENVALHASNAVLLFLLLRRMTKAIWPSAFVAALFALHPLHVESVAWISERKDVLSTLFGLLAVGAYLRYVECKPAKQPPESKRGILASSSAFSFYLLSAVLFVCALLSKPMWVTFPLILLLLDVWPLERVDLGKRLPAWTQIRPLLGEKIPLLLLSVASAIVTCQAQQHAIVDIESIPLEARIENASLAYVRYLLKAVWPAGLAPFYPYPVRFAASPAVEAAVILMLITAAVLALARQAPYLFTGWFWYLVTLVPVIGLVQVGSQSMADRYTYLPLVGIFIVVAWGAVHLLNRWRYRLVFLSATAGCLVAGCGLLTFFQTQYWHSSITLFDRSLAVSPENNGLAHHNLAQALSMKGNQREAIVHFREAVRWWPDFAMAHLNWGNSVAIQGDLEEAMTHYREAIRYRPNCEEAWYNLGNACALQGKLEEAEFNFRQAVKSKPDYAEAFVKFANVLDMQGKIQEAKTNYDAALNARPDYEEAHYYLAGSLARQKKHAEAVTHFRAALKIKPLYPNALNDLAWILATESDPKIRNVPEAVRLATRACGLTKYQNAMYLDTLGVALSEAGDFSKAVAMTEQAVAAAKAAGQNDVAEQVEKRLPPYREGKSYREFVGK